MANHLTLLSCLFVHDTPCLIDTGHISNATLTENLAAGLHTPCDLRNVLIVRTKHPLGHLFISESMSASIALAVIVPWAPISRLFSRQILTNGP